MAELTSEQLAALATDPKSAVGDEGSVTMRSADEILKLNKAAAAAANTGRTRLPVRYGKFIPPGAV